MLIDAREYRHPIAVLFGQRLKRARLAMKLTQGEVAMLAGTTPSYVSQVERGVANPNLQLLVKLAKAVACEAGQMIHPAAGDAI